jgi:hypothetical protein
MCQVALTHGFIRLREIVDPIALSAFSSTPHSETDVVRGTTDFEAESIRPMASLNAFVFSIQNNFISDYLLRSKLV